MARYCVNCGSSLTEHSNFCNICGARQSPIPVTEKKERSTHRPYVPPSPPRARKKKGPNKILIVSIAIIVIIILGEMSILSESENNQNGGSSSQSGSQARFVLSGFSVSPNEVIMGDSFQISVTVSNSGGSQGTYSLIVLVNDVQKSSQNIRLSPKNAETITFQHKTSEYGAYQVEIGGNSETVLAVHKITAYALSAEYEANEVAADEKYEDNILYVEGVIDTIGKDILDIPYITLEDGTTFGGVQFMFKKGDESIVAGLTKGQHVTVRGECEGEIIFNIIFRGSSIID